MATFTGKEIRNTYDAILKLEDNDALTSSLKKITKYYIPCKSKKYLNDLNEKKCIKPYPFNIEDPELNSNFYKTVNKLLN